MEVGKRYYFIVHAYHHFIGEVVEILGTNRVVVNDVIRVQSCQRGWTEFFEEGVKNDTVFTHWPDGKELIYITADPWHHEIPERRKK